MGGRHEYTDQEVTWICESLASHSVASQVLVSMGSGSFLAASELADELAISWCACVTAPIMCNGRCLGVVSGTNDHAYVDPEALATSEISGDELNSLMQTARVEAVRQAADLYRRRVNPVCSSLENMAVILVGTEGEDVPLQFLVRLIRKKNPRSITVLSRFSPHLKAICDNGEFEAFIAIPEADGATQMM